MRRDRPWIGIVILACLTLLLHSFAHPCLAKPKDKKTAEHATRQLSRLVLTGQFREALEMLRGVSDKKENANWKLRLKFLAAYLNLKSKNYGHAVELFQDIQGDYPLLKDYVDFYLAIALRESGKSQDAIKLFSELSARKPPSHLAERLPRELSLAYCKAGDRGTAIDQLNALIQNETSPVKTYHLRFDRAQCLLDLGDKGEAFALLKSLYMNNPEGDLNDIIFSRLQASDPQYRLSIADHRQRAALLLQRSRPDLAVQDLEAASRLEASPSLELQQELGSAYFKARRYREAASIWEKLLRESSTEFGSLDERLDLAKAYARSDQFDPAVSVYQDLIDQHPDGNVSEYLFKIAFIRMDQGKLDESNQLFSDLLQRYPQHPKREQIYWYVAWNHYLLGNFEAADQSFALLQERYPSGKNADRSSYWRARILEKQGKTEAAKAAYESLAQVDNFSYYGFLSLRRLENLSGPENPPRKGWVRDLPRLEVPAPFSLGTLDAEGGKDSTRRLRELLFVGLWEDFLGELNDVAAQEGVSGEFRELSLESNGANANTETSEGRWNEKYPPAYATLVSFFSQTRNLPMPLAWAIMREESHFRPQVVSAAQAIGLMQIIPQTGYEIAKDLGRNGFSPEDLYRPVVNIEYGVQYLAMNLHRFGGNLIYTIASYNAGPEAVERWVKARPKRDWEEFVEEIPYAETQEYVRKVLKSFYLYTLIYNPRQM